MDEGEKRDMEKEKEREEERERKYLYVVCPISLSPSEQYFIQNLMAARQRRIPYTVNEMD